LTSSKVTKLSLILIISLHLAVANDGAAILRGPIADVVDEATYSWGPQNFAGFYYDLGDDIGAEQITLTIEDGSLQKSNVIYSTKAQADTLEFDDWGNRWTMAFQGQEYFAGYADGYLYNESKGANLLEYEKLTKVLLDDDEEQRVGTGEYLILGEGYELQIDEIDLNSDKVSLRLSKNGIDIDASVVEPSKNNATLADKTYTYSRPIGQGDMVFLAVHFKNAFLGSGRDLVTIDGIWQISDETASVREGRVWDKMKIQDLDLKNMTLKMVNEDNSIRLSKDRDSSLMGDFKIKTADQKKVDSEEPLRFCLYKEIVSKDRYEIRGPVAEVENETTFEWNTSNFGGFYYDLDEDLGNEYLILNMVEGRLEKSNGAVYTAKAQEKELEFDDWGVYWTVAFLGDVYFAGYSQGYLYEESDDPNMLSDEQLSKVLVNKDKKMTISTDDPLRLEEGYKLVLKSVNDKGEKVSLELFKDGYKVDSSIVEFLGDSIEDETYVYSREVGKASDVVILAVHFRGAFRSGDDGFAEIDGIWQISDEEITVEEGDDYGKMCIDKVSSRNLTITMINKDHEITLNKNEDFVLMKDMWIKTADQDIVSLNEPLRLYLYKKITTENEHYSV